MTNADLGLRERKKEKTRDALVQAAMELFAKRGFDHVTVEQIAEAGEVSPRTFFRYFATKEDVLFAESDVQRERLLDALAAQPATNPPLLALQHAVLTITEDYGDRREQILARYRILGSTPSLQMRLAQRHHEWEQVLFDAMRDQGRAPKLGDLDLRLLVAAAATTALRIASDEWIAQEGRGDLSALYIRVLNRLREGLEA